VLQESSKGCERLAELLAQVLRELVVLQLELQLVPQELVALNLEQKYLGE
jgi:hypothetical protein